MLSRRLIVCLDVRGDRVVKGVSFRDLRDVGDPAVLAERYENEGADEIVFLDVSASVEERAIFVDVVSRTAARLFIPLTVGGGVRTADDVARVLRAGADRVSINTAAVARPALLADCAVRFGRQAVVASIDAKKTDDGWRVHSHGGSIETDLDAVAWAEQCAECGAGEIMLTSIDRDGTREGYDIGLTSAVTRAVGIPVIASGGAGNAQHVVTVLRDAKAEAALVAGIIHDGVTTIASIKGEMKANGLRVRGAADV